MWVCAGLKLERIILRMTNRVAPFALLALLALPACSGAAYSGEPDPETAKPVTYLLAWVSPMNTDQIGGVVGGAYDRERRADWAFQFTYTESRDGSCPVDADVCAKLATREEPVGFYDGTIHVPDGSDSAVRIETVYQLGEWLGLPTDPAVFGPRTTPAP